MVSLEYCLYIDISHASFGFPVLGRATVCNGWLFQDPRELVEDHAISQDQAVEKTGAPHGWEKTPPYFW